VTRDDDNYDDDNNNNNKKQKQNYKPNIMQYAYISQKETTKIRMYKTITRPVVLCGSEARCLTANGEKHLRIWERKVLRKITGPICVGGYWRSRTNEEVRQLFGELDIVTEIKKGRLRWLGHVERTSEERVVKTLYQNIPEGSRSVGRPRLRWMDTVREDLRRMGVTNWRICAHRRDDWKMVVKEAEVLQGL